MIATEEDFWKLVDKKSDDECWNWKGAFLAIQKSGRGGYGTFRGGKNKILAHRFVYIITFGDIPEGMCICHKCDNRLCCNPAHLFLGTYSDNTRDMIAKGRDDMSKRKGDLCPYSKYSEKTIFEVKRRVKNGERQKDVAIDLNIHPKSIWHLVHRKTIYNEK